MLCIRLVYYSVYYLYTLAYQYTHYMLLVYHPVYYLVYYLYTFSVLSGILSVYYAPSNGLHGAQNRSIWYKITNLW